MRAWKVEGWVAARTIGREGEVSGIVGLWTRLGGRDAWGSAHVGDGAGSSTVAPVDMSEVGVFDDGFRFGVGSMVGRIFGGEDDGGWREFSWRVCIRMRGQVTEIKGRMAQERCI